MGEGVDGGVGEGGHVSVSSLLFSFSLFSISLFHLIF